MKMTVDQRSLLLSGPEWPGWEFSICAGPFPARRTVTNILGCSSLPCRRTWAAIVAGQVPTREEVMWLFRGATEAPVGATIATMEELAPTAILTAIAMLRRYALDNVSVVGEYMAAKLLDLEPSMLQAFLTGRQHVEIEGQPSVYTD